VSEASLSLSGEPMVDTMGDGLGGVVEIGVGCSGSFPPSELDKSVPCVLMPASRLARSLMYFLALAVASVATLSSKSSVVMAVAINAPTVFRL